MSGSKEERGNAKEPGELEMFTAVALVIVIIIQFEEYFRTGCFSFADNNEICGDGLKWYFWVVIAFEAAFPVLTSYRYYRWKKTQY